MTNDLTSAKNRPRFVSPARETVPGARMEHTRKALPAQPKFAALKTRSSLSGAQPGKVPSPATTVRGQGVKLTRSAIRSGRFHTTGPAGTSPKAGPAEPIPKMGTCVPKMSGMGGCYCGRRGLPATAIGQLYADYLRLGSLAKAGKLHGRTRQSVFNLFKPRGLKLFKRNFKQQIEYRGRKYTLSKGDYYRDTIFRSGKYTEETFLHRRVWVDNFGPIPHGHDVGFKDRDRSNCAPNNLICLPHAEYSSYTATGENGATKSAKQRMAMLLAGEGPKLFKRRLA
jgi:HNH endonuclease